MSDSEGSAAPDNEGAVLFDDHGKLPAPDDTPLTIGSVSRMFNVSRLRLLLYERCGLIRRRHRIGRTFVYGWVDCDRLAFIIKARRIGLTARQVAPMIKAAEVTASVQSIKDARAQCLELIDRLDHRRRVLREALGELQHIYKLLSKKLPESDDGVAHDDADTRDPA